MHFIFKFKFFDVLKNTFPMIFSATVMGCVGYLLKLISEKYVWHFIVVAICILLYFTVLLLFFPSLRREILSSKYALKIKNKFLKH